VVHSSAPFAPEGEAAGVPLAEVEGGALDDAADRTGLGVADGDGDGDRVADGRTLGVEAGATEPDGGSWSVGTPLADGVLEPQAVTSSAASRASTAPRARAWDRRWRRQEMDTNRPRFRTVRPPC
jgi:hypothetical protein